MTAKGPVATDRDLQALRWVGEIYGVRSDTLAVLLGRFSEDGARAPLGRRGVQRVIRRWRDAGWVRSAQVEQGGLLWVWPLPAAGLGWPVWRPRLGEIGHVHAVGVVRLLVEGRWPECLWVSERVIRRERLSAYVPDAVVEFPAGSAAVEVELSVKGNDRLRGLMSRLASEYPRVFYFAAPRVMRRVERRVEELKLGELVQVLSLPSVDDVVAEDHDRGLRVPNVLPGRRSA